MSDRAEYHHDYYLKNKERLNAQKAERYRSSEKTRAQHREANRRYWQRISAERGERRFASHSLPLRLRLQRLLGCIKQRCRKPERTTYAGKGIKCLIDFNDLWDVWHRDGADKMTRPSIDRIDNDGDYSRGNIRFRELADNIRDGVKVREAKKLNQEKAA